MKNFKLFTLIGDKDENQHGHGEEPILLNTQHIVSVKPINMVVDGEIIEGYWIRTTNGKKYRAVKGPAEINQLLRPSTP